MRSFRSTCVAGLVLCAAACGSSGPAPGTVLSSQVFAIPAGETLIQACDELCYGDGGAECSECKPQNTSEGSAGLACEKVECGTPPTGHS